MSMSMTNSHRRVPINCIVERVFISDQALREAVNNANDRLSTHSGCKSSANLTLTAVFDSLLVDCCDSSTGSCSSTATNATTNTSTTTNTNTNTNNNNNNNGNGSGNGNGGKSDAKLDGDAAQWGAATFQTNAKNESSATERNVNVTSTVIGENFVVISAEALFSDVLTLALQELKYNMADVLHVLGLIQIKRWKPLLLSAIPESPSATIGEILGEIANNVTLRIKLITMKPQQVPSWINLLRSSTMMEQFENGIGNGDRGGAFNLHSNPNAPANAFAAICANDFRNVFGNLTALAAAKQQASLFGAPHKMPIDRCPCPEPNSPHARARSFGGGAELSPEQFLGPLQSLPPSSLAAFMLFQHHAQQAASLHGEIPSMNPLLLAEAAGINGGPAAHCNGALRGDLLPSDLKCVDLANLRRESSVNYGIVGISSDSGDAKGLCSHQQQQRLRTSFDTEHEIPLLQRWFGENQHPSREQMVKYLNVLNSLESRRSRRQLDLTNIIYWFKNSRAAWRRSSRAQPTRAGDVTFARPDAPDGGAGAAVQMARSNGGTGVESSVAEHEAGNEASNTCNETQNDSGEISVDSDGEDDEMQSGNIEPDADAEEEVEVDEGDGRAENNNDTSKPDSENQSENENENENARYTPSNSAESAHSQDVAKRRAGSDSTYGSQLGIDVKSGGSFKLLGEQSRKRTRIFVDPLTEVPYLESWFLQDPHPNMQMIETYCAHLNTSDYRSKFPKLEPKNIQLWFKNHRSKVKRLCAGVGDQVVDGDSSLANEVA